MMKSTTIAILMLLISFDLAVAPTVINYRVEQKSEVVIDSFYDKKVEYGWREHWFLTFTEDEIETIKSFVKVIEPKLVQDSEDTIRVETLEHRGSTEYMSYRVQVFRDYNEANFEVLWVIFTIITNLVVLVALAHNELKIQGCDASLAEKERE